jgi:hypothetical protein
MLAGHGLPHDTALWSAKPLAIVLAAVTRPLPVDHAFQSVVELAVAVLLAALFVTGQKTGGSLAGFVALVAFVAMPGFMNAFMAGEIDAVTTSLVLLAVATSGRVRSAFLVLAGLLRPEAWLIAGLVAFSQASGSKWRRLLIGVTTSALAPAAWLAFIALATGGLGGSIGAAQGGLRATSWAAPYTVAKAVGVESGVFLGAIGLMGLSFRYGRESVRNMDLLPLALVTIWPAELALGYFRGLPPSDRYVLPVVAILALEAGRFLARASARMRVLNPQPVFLGSLAAVGVVSVVLSTGLTTHDRASAADHMRIRGSIHEIDSSLDCGRLLITGPERIRREGLVPRALANFVPEIAAVSGQTLKRFVLASDRSTYGAVLQIYGRVVGRPDWRRSSLPIGQLALSPGCRM